MLTKKSRFFGTRSPKAPLEKFWGQSAKKRYLNNSSNGDTLWVDRGSNPWGGKRPIPPKSARE